MSFFIAGAIVVGAAVTIGTTIYSTQEAKKAAKKAQQKKEEEAKKAESLARESRKQVAIQEDDSGAKVQDSSATEGTGGTSLDDMFIGKTEPSTTGIAGTTPIKTTLGT